MSFAVALSGPASYETGDAVGILIDPADVHLFSVENGARINALASLSPIPAAS